MRIILLIMIIEINVSLFGGLSEPFFRTYSKDLTAQEADLSLLISSLSAQKTLDDYLASFFTDFDLRQSFNEIKKQSRLTVMIDKYPHRCAKELQLPKWDSLFTLFMRSSTILYRDDIIDYDGNIILENSYIPSDFFFDRTQKKLSISIDHGSAIKTIQNYSSPANIVISALFCKRENLYIIIRKTFIEGAPFCLEIWSDKEQELCQRIDLTFKPSSVVFSYINNEPYLVVLNDKELLIFERQKITSTGPLTEEQLLKRTMLVRKMASSNDKNDQDVLQWHNDWQSEFETLPSWIKERFPDYQVKNPETEPKKRSLTTLLAAKRTSFSNLPAGWLVTSPRPRSAGSLTDLNTNN